MWTTFWTNCRKTTTIENENECTFPSTTMSWINSWWLNSTKVVVFHTNSPCDPVNVSLKAPQLDVKSLKEHPWTPVCFWHAAELTETVVDSLKWAPSVTFSAHHSSQLMSHVDSHVNSGSDGRWQVVWESFERRIMMMMMRVRPRAAVVLDRLTCAVERISKRSSADAVALYYSVFSFWRCSVFSAQCPSCSYSRHSPLCRTICICI